MNGSAEFYWLSRRSLSDMVEPKFYQKFLALGKPQYAEDLVNARRSGAGRKQATEKNPDLKEILQEIIEPETRGGPETPLRWTCKSVRNIADALKKEKLIVSHQTVAAILRELEYSLQGNKKTKGVRIIPIVISSFFTLIKLRNNF